MIFITVFFLVLLAILILFSFPQFSPIPYFPSNKKDLPLIIKSFNLKNNQTVFDLGAGDGMVVFEAAKESYRRKLNTQLIAVEINPILLCILYIRRLFHPNRKNIRIMYGNMFNMNFPHLTINPYHLTFYLYISPWHLEKTVKNIQRYFAHYRIVSYMYQIPCLSNLEKKRNTIVNPIYSYKMN